MAHNALENQFLEFFLPNNQNSFGLKMLPSSPRSFRIPIRHVRCCKYKVSSISSSQTKSTSFFKKTKAYFSKFAFAMTLRSPEMSHHYCLVSDILSFFPLFSHHNQIFPLNGIQLLFSHYSLVLN